MKSDTEIRAIGYKILFQYMDVIDAERFISLINREKFDYTKWSQNLFEEKTIEEILTDAKKFAIDFRKIQGTIN